MSKPQSPGTQLVVFLVSKVGMRDAIKVATFLIQWGTVARKLKREPTWPEFCAYWGESRATYFRSWKLYREVWPDDRSPQVRWEWVDANVKIPKRASVDDAANALLLAAVP